MALDQLRALLGPQTWRSSRCSPARRSSRTTSTSSMASSSRSTASCKEIETGEIDYQSLQAGGDEYTQPIVRLVDALLVDAVKRGASDIHFEPEYAFLRIRYRIDGVLRADPQPAQDLLARHRRAAQGDQRHEHRRDARAAGRAAVAHPERPADRLPRLRPADDPRREHRAARARPRKVASSPRAHGPAAETLSDAASSCSPGPRASSSSPARPAAARPPRSTRCSAQSTTSRQHHDPGGPGRVPGDDDAPDLGQRGRAKLDFANGIRSMMRQDPDIILVGEVRDQDTAEMAFRAAMTGHQVFTTLHTNSALGAFPAAARHRHPARHHGRQHHRRHRAAPGARALPALPRGLRALAEERGVLGVCTR